MSAWCACCDSLRRRSASGRRRGGSVRPGAALFDWDKEFADQTGQHAGAAEHEEPDRAGFQLLGEEHDAADDEQQVDY